jgi:hypothetical protein
MRLEGPPFSDRVAASLVYLLPATDGFGFGGYIYSHVPRAGDIAYAVLPFVNAFDSLPFASLGLFIGLSVLTRNENISRFVRFNIQQALLLDITLIMPGVFGQVGSAMPTELQVFSNNLIFYYWLLVVGYSLFSNLRGETPNQVPVLSEAASPFVS